MARRAEKTLIANVMGLMREGKLTPPFKRNRASSKIIVITWTRSGGCDFVMVRDVSHPPRRT